MNVGVKNCYISGKDHLARKSQKSEDIKSALDKLKAKHPTALLTVRNLGSVYYMDEAGDGHSTDSDSDWVQRSE